MGCNWGFDILPIHGVISLLILGKKGAPSGMMEVLKCHPPMKFASENRPKLSQSRKGSSSSSPIWIFRGKLAVFREDNMRWLETEAFRRWYFPIVNRGFYITCHIRQLRGQFPKWNHIFFVDLLDVFCRMERTSFENHIKTTYVEQTWEKAVKNNKILEDILRRIDSWYASPKTVQKNTFLCVPCAFSCGPSSGTTAKLLLDLNRCATATLGKPDANQKHSCSHIEVVKTTKTAASLATFEVISESKHPLPPIPVSLLIFLPGHRFDMGKSSTGSSSSWRGGSWESW